MPDDTLGVKILEREYLVACPENERTALQSAANHLDKKMRDIRNSGKVHGVERIAVMAALNITYELLENDDMKAGDQQILSEIEDKLDLALKSRKKTSKA